MINIPAQLLLVLARRHSPYSDGRRISQPMYFRHCWVALECVKTVLVATQQLLLIVRQLSVSLDGLVDVLMRRSYLPLS